MKECEKVTTLNTATCLFYERLNKKEYIVLYAFIMVLNIIYLLIAAQGMNSDWYYTFTTQFTTNSLAVAVLWLFFTIMSYGALFLLWEHIDVYYPYDLKLSIWYLIISILNVVWVSIFFLSHNIGLALVFLIITFLVYYGLMIYIASIKIAAAIFMLPLAILYIWFIYNMATVWKGDA